METYSFDQARSESAAVFEKIVKMAETKQYLSRTLEIAKAGVAYYLTLDLDLETVAAGLWEIGEIIGEAVQRYAGIEFMLTNEEFCRAQMQNEISAVLCSMAHLLFEQAEDDVTNAEAAKNS